MRFIVGPPPDSPDFAPEQQRGWTRLRVPSPWALQLWGSLLGFVLGGLMFFAWSLLPYPASSLTLSSDTMGSMSRWAVPLVFILAPLVAFGAMILVHELLHLVAAPGCGLSRNSILGLWPRKMMPYADYQGPMPCWRACVVAVMPFVVLSIGPWGVSLLMGAKSSFWAFVSVFNALACGGDAILCGAHLAQIPLGAIVQNKGWDTWWRGVTEPEELTA